MAVTTKVQKYADGTKVKTPAGQTGTVLRATLKKDLTFVYKLAGDGSDGKGVFGAREDDLAPA